MRELHRMSGLGVRPAAAVCSRYETTDAWYLWR